MTFEKYIFIAQKDEMKSVAARVLAEYFSFPANNLTRKYLDVNRANLNSYLRTFFRETGLAEIVGKVYPNTNFDIEFDGNSVKIQGADANIVTSYFISAKEMFDYIAKVKGPRTFSTSIKYNFRTLNSGNNYGGSYNTFLQRFYNNTAFNFPTNTEIFIREDFETNGSIINDDILDGIVTNLQEFLYSNYRNNQITDYFRGLFTALNVNINNDLSVEEFNNLLNQIFIAYGWGVWNQRVDISMTFGSDLNTSTFIGADTQLTKFQNLFLTPDQLEDLVETLSLKANMDKSDSLALSLTMANAIYNTIN